MILMRRRIDFAEVAKWGKTPICFEENPIPDSKEGWKECVHLKS